MCWDFMEVFGVLQLECLTAEMTGPAVWGAQDRVLAAVMLLGAHFGAWFLADEIILAEIPGESLTVAQLHELSEASCQYCCNHASGSALTSLTCPHASP